PLTKGRPIFRRIEGCLLCRSFRTSGRTAHCSQYPTPGGCLYHTPTPPACQVVRVLFLSLPTPNKNIPNPLLRSRVQHFPVVPAHCGGGSTQNQLGLLNIPRRTSGGVSIARAQIRPERRRAAGRRGYRGAGRTPGAVRTATAAPALHSRSAPPPPP